MQDTLASGSCPCGAVRYEITGSLGIFQYCHCSRCRKFTGSAHSANLVVSPEQFRWVAGEAHVGRFELPEAKQFATCLCRRCGSSLPWLGKTGKAVVVPAGTFDTDPHIRPTQIIFWGSHARWYTEADTLPRYEALPTR